MKRRILIATLPLAVIIAIPVLLHEETVTDNPDARQLVILSPHNEAIRYEFENAFRRDYRARFGEDVDIDWRTPGGTSEIVHFIRASFTAAFRAEWIARGRDWSGAVRNAFMNRKLKKTEATDEEWEARRAFLQGTTGIGVDLFFGGGQYDFGRLASMGILVPCGLRERRPELFTGPSPVLSEGKSGEIWYDPQDRYYGACLSSFGICFNPDRLAELGYRPDDPQAWPRRWQDLADARLFRQLGVADPSKSGSITKCFENLIQEQMARSVDRLEEAQKREPDRLREAVAEGWSDAMLLIRKIGGNARFFTFSASKVPLGVARGNVAAGMCIDFYGNSQAEWEQKHVGRPTLVYIAPVGGSSVSADPIGMLRGAPHEKTARAFIDFVFSVRGQRLWNYRVGEPDGPETYALRRLPIRRDCYSPEERAHMSDPEADPFGLTENFQYHPEWTGRLFSLSRVLIRVMVIDCHAELQEAWGEILRAGGPRACPAAMAFFAELPFSYREAGDAAREIQHPERRVIACRKWAVFFRDRYREAARAARARTAASPET